MKRFLLTALVLSLLSAPLRAEEAVADYDPMARNLIYVSAQSEIKVPVDRFSASFNFDVEKDSFTNANREAAKVLDSIRAGMQKIKGIEFNIVSGWDLIKQDRIDWSSKGRNISNRATIEVTGFENGRLHEIVAEVIDLALKANNNVALQNIEVSLTEETEKAARTRLLKESVEELRRQANEAAASLGVTLDAPKRIFVNGQQVPQPVAMQEGYGMMSMMRSPISVQKSFTVNAQIPDSMQMSTNATGVYETV